MPWCPWRRPVRHLPHGHQRREHRHRPAHRRPQPLRDRRRRALLVALGLAAPVSRALAGIPEAVVGGSALVVYAVIAVMGVEMLRRADLSGTGTGSLTAALALTAGLLPLLSPDLYAGFPAGPARSSAAASSPAP
ncbi:hypothetical protein O1L60_36015 [Streptomyces diastatochromogenes]|nr:hypothetical protein [Streptomyces diastatochromogenes]